MKQSLSSKVNKMTGKKILEICNYSSDNCGVFARVKQESLLLSKEGYEVRIFSSDFNKGNGIRLPLSANMENISIQRFKAKKLGGESFITFNFKKEALNYNPDVIIVHSYRHLHTTKALKVAKKIGCKIFLVTHAPFQRGVETRGLFANFSVKFYDKFIGPRKLRKFTKVIAITNWEIPYLNELGVSSDRITIIPNGIPSEFFSKKVKVKQERKILFLGRVAMIKSLETPLKSLSLMKTNIGLDITGPVSEANYLVKLEEIIAENKIESKVSFNKPIFDIKAKIDKYDSSEFFILPSISEGMPQSLIEAMARGKIVIASDITANRNLIKDKINGFLFKQGDEKALAQLIEKLCQKNKKELDKISKNAKEYAKRFDWASIVKKIESVIEE